MDTGRRLSHMIRTDDPIRPLSSTWQGNPSLRLSRLVLDLSNLPSVHSATDTRRQLLQQQDEDEPNNQYTGGGLDIIIAITHQVI